MCFHLKNQIYCRIISLSLLKSEEMIIRKKLSGLLILALSLWTPFVPADVNQILPVAMAKTPLYQPRIIGGEEAEPGDWPWMAAVARGQDLYKGFLCGGSLIHANWVLTAAHCTYTAMGTIRNNLDVVLGTNDLTAPQDEYERIQVIQVIPHPNYDDFTLDNDIALLKLSESSTQKPITWLTPDKGSTLVLPGTETIQIGWGTIDPSFLNYPESLMQVNVPTVSNKTCREALEPLLITENMFCTGLQGGGKDACVGDSGGPVMVANGRGDYALAGLISWGVDKACGSPGYYGVNTRLSKYSDWISTYVPIQVEEDPKACLYSLSLSNQSFTYKGGTGSVSVITEDDCEWTVENNASWVEITSETGGTGNGAVEYSVSTNINNESRTATLTIAGETFMVEQDGILTIGGSTQDEVVNAAIDTNRHDQVMLRLNQKADNGIGQIYISVQVLSISEWTDYLWFRPNDTHTPPYLVLGKDSMGFLSDAHAHYYFRGPLSRSAKDLDFILGDLSSLLGYTIVFKSWYLKDGLVLTMENLGLIQSIEVTFY
jgi:secreted trypsin-like serine protease